VDASGPWYSADCLWFHCLSMAYSKDLMVSRGRSWVDRVGLLLSGSAFGALVRLSDANCCIQRALTNWSAINVRTPYIVQRLKSGFFKGKCTWLRFVDGGIRICLCGFRHVVPSLFCRRLLQRRLALVILFRRSGLRGG
jgi:hypothetical protein